MPRTTESNTIHDAFLEADRGPGASVQLEYVCLQLSRRRNAQKPPIQGKDSNGRKSNRKLQEG